MSLKRKRRVLRSEEIEIPGTTLSGLLTAVRQAVSSSPFKVERLLYSRGKPVITVERLVPEDLAPEPGDDEFLTPYQMVRQHSDIRAVDISNEGLATVARAVQLLTAENYRLTMFVCSNRDFVVRWLGDGLRPDHVWQVPLVEDPDVGFDGIIAVGSTRGNLVSDIEAAVICQIGG